MLILAALVLTGCVKQPPLGKTVLSPPTARAPYEFVKVGELYYVVGRNEQAKADALAAIGCGRQSVCAVGEHADFWIVKAIPK